MIWDTTHVPNAKTTILLAMNQGHAPTQTRKRSGVGKLVVHAHRQGNQIADMHILLWYYKRSSH